MPKLPRATNRRLKSVGANLAPYAVHAEPYVDTVRVRNDETGEVEIRERKRTGYHVDRWDSIEERWERVSTKPAWSRAAAERLARWLVRQGRIRKTERR